MLTDTLLTDHNSIFGQIGGDYDLLDHIVSCISDWRWAMDQGIVALNRNLNVVFINWGISQIWMLERQSTE